MLRNSVQKNTSFWQRRGVTGRILVAGIPLTCAVFVLTFLVMNTSIEAVLQNSVARNAQLQAQTISITLEQILAEARNQLLILAEGSISQQDMMRRLKFRAQAAGLRYREVAFMGVEPESRYLCISYEGKIIAVPEGVFMNASGSPFKSMGSRQKAGHVSIGQPEEVVYSLVPVNDSLQSLTFQVVRLSTPVYVEGKFQGVLCLSLDLKSLRNTMSQLGAPDPPLSHDGSPLRSFFFDREGWLLFQAEPPEKDYDSPLASGTVRIGYRGDFGRPGFNLAFRPEPDHLDYWRMVADVGDGRSGRLRLSGQDARQAEAISYAPVMFSASLQGPRSLIGGVAILDNNFTMKNNTRLLRLLFVSCCLGAMLLMTICLWWLGWMQTKSIKKLGRMLQASNDEDTCGVLPLPQTPLEVKKLGQEINLLLRRLDTARLDRQLQENEQREKWQNEAVEDLPRAANLPSHGLVGRSPVIQALLHKIVKSSQVDADVLIVGETGTGKELVSAFIHRQSKRASGPYITINCGALDEALLMDTLFGHVKGAFTEAKQSRKGAFLAAEGGTLMLDEVGNAAPKVQQALLRALSTRRIRPLGSDQELPFDTRIIAATNAELRDEGQEGAFRSDLYYRLAVITIHTPPLRQRKEDIPALVVFFLAEALCRQADGDDGATPVLPRLSRGALAKLTAHDWPGNVRELKNTITRALAFCHGSMILAGDIQLDDQGSPHPPSNSPLRVPLESEKQLYGQDGERVAKKSGQDIEEDTGLTVQADGEASTADPEELNSRQREMLLRMRDMGSISRQQYQDLAGGGISMRTAQYDLQILVRLGFLRKEGRGPAQRYVLVYDRPDDI